MLVELLDVRLIPQLRDKRTNRRCAPAHFAFSVQEVLNKQCLGCCSPTSPVSLLRPPRVPDLITRVKSLFHCVIKVQPPAHSDESRRVVECACTAIRLQALQRMPHGACLYRHKVTGTSAYATRSLLVPPYGYRHFSVRHTEPGGLSGSVSGAQECTYR